jgi:hypothetical protein
MLTSTRASILISTLVAAASLSSHTSAQAPAIPTPVCPARYEPMDGHCYDTTSGDIVLAGASRSTSERPSQASLAAARTGKSANCRAGYAILFKTLCYSHLTGDIELPDENKTNVAGATRIQR